MDYLSVNGRAGNPDYDQGLLFYGDSPNREQDLGDEALLNTFRKLPDFQAYEEDDESRVNYFLRRKPKANRVEDFNDPNDPESLAYYQYLVSQGFSDGTSLNAVKLRSWKGAKNFNEVPDELRGIYEDMENPDFSIGPRQNLVTKLEKDIKDLTLRQLEENPELVSKMRIIKKANENDTSKRLGEYFENTSFWLGLGAVALATGGVGLGIGALGEAGLILGRLAGVIGIGSVGASAVDRYQAGVDLGTNIEASAAELAAKGAAFLLHINSASKSMTESVLRAGASGAIFSGFFALGDELADKIAFDKDVNYKALGLNSLIGGALGGAIGGTMFHFIGNSHSSNLIRREVADSWLKTKGIEPMTDYERDVALGESLSTPEKLDEFMDFANENFEDQIVFNRVLDAIHNDDVFKNSMEEALGGNTDSLIKDRMSYEVLEKISEISKDQAIKFFGSDALRKAPIDSINSPQREALVNLGQNISKAETFRKNILKGFDERVKNGENPAKVFADTVTQNVWDEKFGGERGSTLPNLRIATDKMKTIRGDNKTIGRKYNDAIVKLKAFLDNNGWRDSFDLQFNETNWIELVSQTKDKNRLLGGYATLTQDSPKVVYSIKSRNPALLEAMFKADHELNGGLLFDSSERGISTFSDIVRENLSSRAREFGKFKHMSDASRMTPRKLMENPKLKKWDEGDLYAFLEKKLMEKYENNLPYDYVSAIEYEYGYDSEFFAELIKPENIEKIQFAEEFGHLPDLERETLEKIFDTGLDSLKMNSHKINNSERVISYNAKGKKSLENEIRKLLTAEQNNSSSPFLDDVFNGGLRTIGMMKAVALLGSPAKNFVEGITNFGIEKFKGNWFKFKVPNDVNYDSGRVKDFYNSLLESKLIDTKDFNYKKTFKGSERNNSGLLGKNEDILVAKGKNLVNSLSKYLIDDLFAYGDYIGRSAKLKYLIGKMTTLKDGKVLLEEGGVASQRYGRQESLKYLNDFTESVLKKENFTNEEFVNYLKENVEVQQILNDVVTSNNMSRNFYGDLYMLEKHLKGERGIGQYLKDLIMPFMGYTVSSSGAYYADLKLESERKYYGGEKSKYVPFSLSPIHRRFLKLLLTGVVTDMIYNLQRDRRDKYKKDFSASGLIESMRDEAVKNIGNIGGLSSILGASFGDFKGIGTSTYKKIKDAGSLVYSEGLNKDTAPVIASQLFPILPFLFSFYPEDTPFKNVRSYKLNKAQGDKLARKKLKDKIARKKKEKGSSLTFEDFENSNDAEDSASD